MKNLLSTVLIALLTITSSSAQSFVERHYGELMDREDATLVNVSGKMFEMISKFGDAVDEEEAKEAMRMMQDIEAFTLLKLDNRDDAAALFGRGKGAIGDYDELVRVQSSDADVIISIDETNGIVHEIVGIINAKEDNTFVVASLIGRIDLDDVSKMVAKFQEQALPMIQERTSTSIDDVRIFPNPVDGGAVMTLEIDEAMIGGTATVMDLAGRSIKSYELNGVITSIQTGNLAAGQHFIEVIGDDKSIKKQFIVVR